MGAMGNCGRSSKKFFPAMVAPVKIIIACKVIFGSGQLQTDLRITHSVQLQQIKNYYGIFKHTILATIILCANQSLMAAKLCLNHNFVVVNFLHYAYSFVVHSAKEFFPLIPEQADQTDNRGFVTSLPSSII